MAAAGGEGALLNVQINLEVPCPTTPIRTTSRVNLQRLYDALGPAAQRCRDAVRAVMEA